jgi:magnesium-protoporphyrin O-methyltransferase
MVDSCQCEGIESKFDEKYVAKKLAVYREQGPKHTTVELLGALKAKGVNGLSLLDIGGGVGDIQFGLFEMGIVQAQAAEASLAYLEASKLEAKRLGLSDKISFVHGDFVEASGAIGSSDIVTLDRVICCFDDMEKLVALSTQKARQYYGIVYPRDIWWAKIGIQLYYNSRNWLMGNPMRYFIYATEAVEGIVIGNGFERRFHKEIGAWQVALFERV